MKIPVFRHLNWLILCCSFCAHAVTDFKIITLQHRFADDILPIIQSIAPAGAAVTGMQNHIVVRASPEKLAEIELIIARLDVAQQNLKITVSHQNHIDTSLNGVGVSGRKRIGNVEVRTNRYSGNAPDGAQINIENRQSNTQSNNNQFINVLDGQPAFIRVGQSVPFTQEWVTFTRRYARAERTTEFVDITTGFSVRPRSIGNQVELEITPRIAQLNQQGFIDFEELSTTVRVNKGEWFDLGGTMQQKDEVSRAILSKQSLSQTQNSSLSIKVD